MDAGTGIITLICGTGEPGYAGDGGPAVDAVINQPYGLAIDVNGDIYFAQRFDPAVRKIDGRTGMISTVAGTGEFGYSGDGGPGNEAMLREPNDLCLDHRGGLLIADVQDQRIRRVDLGTGIITTFAGTGEKSRDGDGKAATEACLMGPRAVCADSQGQYLRVRAGGKRGPQNSAGRYADHHSRSGGGVRLLRRRRTGAGGHLGIAQSDALRLE